MKRLTPLLFYFERLFILQELIIFSNDVLHQCSLGNTFMSLSQKRKWKDYENLPIIRFDASLKIRMKRFYRKGQCSFQQKKMSSTPDYADVKWFSSVKIREKIVEKIMTHPICPRVSYPISSQERMQCVVVITYALVLSC